MIDPTTIDTTIYIGNLAIHQPVTVFTSYLIFGLCFYFYLQLKRIKNVNSSTSNWGRFFLMIGLASFVGSFAHAFFAVHEGLGYKLFWLSMQALNIFSVYFAQQATLNSALQNSVQKNFWKLSYDIQLILFFSAVFIFHNFLVVVVDGVIGMIPIMVIHFMDSKKVKESSWIAYGIVILFLSAIVNITKFSLHAYFNHLDIAHVLVMINLWMMFVGVKRKAIS